MKKVKTIVALQDKDNGIGDVLNLLYHISEDLKRFKSLTLDSAIIMGRKTYESFPKRKDGKRALPDRLNIILTKDENYKPHDKVVVVHNLKQALNKARSHKVIYIIGGGEIYRQALPFVEEIEITRIYGNKEANIFFPDPRKANFFLIKRSRKKKDLKSGVKFRYETWSRKGPSFMEKIKLFFNL